MCDVGKKVVLGALQTNKFGYLVEHPHVLNLQVIELLDVGHAQLMLHEHTVQLYQLHPRGPRWVQPHRIGEQRRHDLDAATHMQTRMSRFVSDWL